MKINLIKFIETTFLLSLLLFPNTGFTQSDKAHNPNDISTYIDNDAFPGAATMNYIDENFLTASGTTPPAGWTQNIIMGQEGIDLWHFDNPGSLPIMPPMSSPVAIFNSYNISNNGLPEDVALESPTFSVAAGAEVMLEWDHYFLSGSGAEIFTEVWDGNAWSEVYSSTATTLNPMHELINITSEAAGVQNAKIRFRWTGNYSRYWLVDNIRVYSMDPPPGPAAPVSPAPGSVDVDINSGLSWTAGMGSAPNGFKLFFGTDGGGITPPTNIEDNTDLLLSTQYLPHAPLLYNTTYYWMIVPYNDAGDAQDTPIWSFTVMEDPPVSVYPYLENFEGSFPPLYYIRYTGLLTDPVTITSTNSGWKQWDWRNVPAPINKAAALNISGTAVNHWLMTTLADLGTGSDYQLEFDLTLNSNGTSNPPETGGFDDRFAVCISTDSGRTWMESNVLKEWNNTGSENVFDEISPDGEHVVIDISDYDGMIQLGFYGESSVSNADNDLMIDNLEIKKILIPPVFFIDPSEMDFGPVGIGGSRVLQAEISNMGDEDLIITQIESADPQFAFSPEGFPFTITPGDSQILNITFSPSVAGTITSTLTITHNTAGSPVTYNLVGTGSDEGPSFSVSSDVLNFGLVPVNTNKNMTVIVSNLGFINELQISTASIIDSGFVVTPAAANIPAGESRTFTITFTPVAAASYSGSLVFISNDPASPHTVSLAGKGAGDSGLLFQQDTVCQLENDVYGVNVQLKGLDPLGEMVHAIQFRLAVNKGDDDNTILTFRNITKGSDVDDDNWVLDYNLFRGPITANGASIDSIYVLLYNLEQQEGLDPSVDYNDLLSIEYRIADLPALTDTLKSSMIISNASATTNNGYPVDISSAKNILSVLAVNRVSSRGDVNGDGYIDILDLIMVVDHIIGKDSLNGENFNRADISPWIPGMREPEPDGIVNVQDLSLIQNIILTGFYPNNNPIRKTASGNLPKVNGSVDAKVKAYITGEGISLYVESNFEIRGAQIEFGNIINSAGEISITTDLGQGYFAAVDSTFRTLLYDRMASKILDRGEHFLADLPFTITNPEVVYVGRVLLIDADRHRLENIEVEIINENAPSLPLDYKLFQNYPNPFNPSTTIQFQIPGSCFVTLKIYNMLGEEIRTLFAGQVMRGTYTLHWDGSGDTGARLSSGTYIYRITADAEGKENFTQVRKMMLIK